MTVPRPISTPGPSTTSGPSRTSFSVDGSVVVRAQQRGHRAARVLADRAGRESRRKPCAGRARRRRIAPGWHVGREVAGDDHHARRRWPAARRGTRHARPARCALAPRGASSSTPSISGPSPSSSTASSSAVKQAAERARSGEVMEAGVDHGDQQKQRAAAHGPAALELFHALRIRARSGASAPAPDSRSRHKPWSCCPCRSSTGSRPCRHAAGRTASPR